MEENVYVFGGKTAKFKATKRYVRFENFPSFIHCNDSNCASKCTDAPNFIFAIK